MKLLLVLLLVSHVFSAPETDAEVARKVARMISEARRNYAKKNNIANMHELKVDKALEVLADGVATICPTLKELQKRNDGEFITWLRDLKSPNKDLSQEDYDKFMNPVQTMIGGSDNAQYSCKKHNRNEYNTFYVMGPESKTIVKYGVPGSQCKEGFVNNDGLCVKKAF